MTTCGTPTGYANGCHGAASCHNHRTGRMTCTEAHVRYAGDYAYRRAVDNGTATDEHEQFAKDKRPTKRVVAETRAEAAKRPVKPVKAKAKRQPKPRRIKAPREKAGPNGRPRGGHGTRGEYQIGCRVRTGCPNEIAGGMSCFQANSQYKRNTRLARLAKLAAA